MTAIKAFQHGWASARRAWLANTLFWLLYSLAAAIVALPAACLAYQPLAHSRLAHSLIERFDVAWLMELAPFNGGPAMMLGAGAILAGIVTWLLGVALAGIALSGVCELWPHHTMERMFAAAGRHFWRLFRLSLFGLPCYAIAVLIGRVPAMVAHKVYGEGMEGAPLAIANIISSVLIVLLIGLVATALDYAKVRLVSDDVRGAFKALLRGFAFFFRHFARTVSIALLNGVLFAVVTAAYLALTNSLSSSTNVIIGITILVQQLYIFFRVFLRTANWGADAALYASCRPLPPEEPVAVPVVLSGEPPEMEAGEEASLDE